MVNAEVRYGRFLLPDPKNEEEPVVMYGVHVLEVEPPGDALPVEWMLLTSLEVGSVADARRVLAMYLKRWRVQGGAFGSAYLAASAASNNDVLCNILACAKKTKGRQI